MLKHSARRVPLSFRQTLRKVAGFKFQGLRLYSAPVRDMQFLRDEVFDFPRHYAKLRHCNGEHVTPDMVGAFIEQNALFAEQVLAPLDALADSQGCVHVDQNTVKTPAGYKEAYAQWKEGNWFGMTLPERYGGQGLPPSLYILVGEMLASANFTWSMFPGLSQGAVNTILLHGSEELKDKFLPRMVSGAWTGTMCLTEPQCGSDLSQVTTRAKPQTDGSFLISGTKIFISCGEHDLTENIVHCVLARLPDAPPGIKGISLFLVPKITVEPDGSLAPGFNGCNIGRIEDKMGCHGSPTCEINFDNAVGFLLGEPHKGMQQMFTFINTSRIGTAMMGVAIAQVSAHNSLAYASARRSMRSLTGVKSPDQQADLIIEHAPVRRMLLTQKAFVEGGRSMLYECAMLHDRLVEARLAGNAVEERRVDDRLGFLTPILKGFLTEVCTQVAHIGVQVYGGHGYIRDNKQEQLLRDIRISTLWEGTTEIQGESMLAILDWLCRGQRGVCA
jgi:alkylation response protein AidB-like acyl-CoA dehydrogenase